MYDVLYWVFVAMKSLCSKCVLKLSKWQGLVKDIKFINCWLKNYWCGSDSTKHSFHAPKGLRTLKETIEDCWDQDGDARLSALCVQERFSELLKDYPDGLSTTSSINPVQKILQNYPVTHSQSPMGVGIPVSNSPPLVVATQPSSEKSSVQGVNMTTVW